MFNNKALQWLIMILIAITLIALASFVLYEMMLRNGLQNDPAAAATGSVENVQPKKLTAEQIKDYTYEMKDITTNLVGSDYIKISFAFLLDSAKARNEFELLQTRVRAIVLQTLADMTAEQVSGSKGMDLIGTTLINKINPILSKGKLTQVDITDFNIARN